MSFVNVNLVLKTDRPTDLSIETTCRRLKKSLKMTFKKKKMAQNQKITKLKDRYYKKSQKMENFQKKNEDIIGDLQFFGDIQFLEKKIVDTI